MKKLLYIVAVVFPLLGGAGVGLAQNKKIDSLLILLKKDKEDTSKVNHLNALAWELSSINPDTSILLSTRALNLISAKFEVQHEMLFEKIKSGLRQKNLDDKQLRFAFAAGQCFIRLGWFYYMKSDYITALENYNMALALCVELKDKNGQAAVLGNMGVVYDGKGDYPKALGYDFKSLRIGEDLGDKYRIALETGNIGIIYKEEGDYPKALEFGLKALKMDEELENKSGMGRDLGNIGNIYAEQGDLQKALDFFLRAFKISEELGNKDLMAIWLGNIGSVYNDQENYPKALEFFFKALNMDEKLGDRSGIARHLGNIGLLYSKQKKYSDAEKMLLRSLNIAEEIRSLDNISDSHESLSDLYAQTGRHGLALDHYKKYIEARDSLINEDNTKKTVRLQMQYEFDKKEAATKLEQEKREAIAAADSRKQRVIIWSICGILILVLAFAVFAYRSYLQKQKANVEITKQKEIIEYKQKEILDSIYYARRIQRSLLTSEKYIEKNLSRLIKSD